MSEPEEMRAPATVDAYVRGISVAALEKLREVAVANGVGSSNSDVLRFVVMQYYQGLQGKGGTDQRGAVQAGEEAA